MTRACKAAASALPNHAGAHLSKRLIVCCDGTWNRPDHVDGGKVQPTNVAKTALALRDRDDAGVRQKALSNAVESD